MKKLTASLILIFITLLLHANPFSGDISLVVIDAGHGGSDPGATGGGVEEKDVVLSLAFLLRDKLLSSGYEVVMTREDDTFISLQGRSDIANSIRYPSVGYPLFISLHANSSVYPEASGFEVYVKGSARSAAFISSSTSPSMILKYASYTRSLLNSYADQVSESVAEEVISSVSESFPAMRMRGVKSNNLYVLNCTWMPALLVEVGFISNEEERENLVSRSWQERMASAIASAIAAF